MFEPSMQATASAYTGQPPHSTSPVSMAGKRILLLQGPVGPFFRNLAKDLRRQGATVYKYNFNAGDWLFYPTGACAFRGPLQAWQPVLQAFVRKHHIDAILLFGDCRPVHALVRKQAAAWGVEVGVFEEGYLRPDFVTLERGGVNAFSPWAQRKPMPAAVPVACTAQAVQAPQQAGGEPVAPVGAAFWHAAVWGMLYFFASWLGQWCWNNRLHHRPMSVLDAPRWWLSFGRKLWFRYTQRRMQAWLTAEKHAQFFLVPLQVYNDAQILVHSDYGSVMHFIARAMQSYAQALRADAQGVAQHGAQTSLQQTVLVFKHHPMDRGHRHYGRAIARLSEQMGLQGRVHYIHDQHLPSLLKAARGVVVVNSTVGLSALAHGAAVKVCGRALYDQPGLTFQGSLAQFWHAAPQYMPSKTRVAAFRQRLVAGTQLNGNFYRKLAQAGNQCGVVFRQALAQRLWGSVRQEQADRAAHAPQQSAAAVPVGFEQAPHQEQTHAAP